MKSFPINDIPEFSKKDRIVVVGIIGKSPYRYPNKTTPLVPSAECKENGIECSWDERRGVLYLHAVTHLDTRRLAELAANLDENSKCTEKEADAAHWLVAAGELATAACRALALVFHLAHIVVLSSPGAVFDLGYLQLFKAIDAYRLELAPLCAEALGAAGAGGAWLSHGRCCCPRLVFHFRRAPSALRRRPAALKRREHAVEDQLYFILRKARIITNVCAKSLFAIPKNEEFVYISSGEVEGEGEGGARDVSTLVRGLVQLCGGGAPPATGATGATGAVGTERPSLQQFLAGHIELARGAGFDDNVGKYASTTSFFQLPSASSWRRAARALAPLYLPPHGGEGEGVGVLHDALATDVRFSQARCAKVLPIAQASYTEGLPAHYSSQHHAHKVEVALGVLETMARGPLAAGARARLRAACAAAWAARRLCEAPSLTHHPCIHPEHDSSREHSSGVRYVSACSCGRCKCSREDPYSVRRANYTFYQQAAEECGVCPTLQQIQFPVFQPSTPTYKAASVRGASSQEERGERGERGERDGREGSPDAATEPSQEEWSPDALSPGSPPSPASPASGASPAPPEVPPPRRDDKYVVQLRTDSHPEKAMSRQPSTTEYLPGMLHLASPESLLPAFPSWSLLCLGASSLYSHALGLPEHLQPGLLPHTNHLLPWDTHLHTEAPSAWRGGGAGGRGARGGKGGSHHLAVKIFIGFEYECPRGHRLMMGPDGPISSGGGGGGGGGAGGGSNISSAAGAKLAASDMPLCAPCLCRGHGGAGAGGAGGAGGAAATPAYLTRIHVVTPKAPVHVTLDPRAQPVPGGPVFVPQPAGAPPIKLSASAYWVLRLPHMYADERGVLPRPRPAPPHQGSLLAPVFGLQE